MNAAINLEFDALEATRFLDALCCSDCRNEVFTFQTFSGGKNGGALAKTWSDTFSRETTGHIKRLNNAGAGIFVTVNKTDGKGRKNKNVTAVRAPFVDLDGSPIDPVKEWRLRPYIIVESSPGRYHAYWRHNGSVKLEDFKQLQLKLAVKFNGDTSVHDRPRVMRLPGAWHLKCEPFQTRLVSIDESAPAYSVSDFELALIDVKVPERMFATPKGERKLKERCRSAREWLNQEALFRIEDWAPRFFPCGYVGSQGEWRVPPTELGRPQCEEALSIHCDGIKDWATGNWADHIEADKYTAIGLLKAFFTESENGQPELVEDFDEYGAPVGGLLGTDHAAEFLAEALGENWQALVQEFQERMAADFENTASEGEADDADEFCPPAFSDEALALSFADEHAEKLRYIAAWSKWLWWDGKRWNTDDTVLAYDLARKVCRKAAADANEPAVRKKTCSANTIAAVERLARADRRLAATTGQWDADPWLLNTPDGIIDLRSGEIRPHQPTDYMTKMTAVEPGGACPQWRKFLNRIFAGDAELIAFVQRVAVIALPARHASTLCSSASAPVLMARACSSTP